MDALTGAPGSLNDEISGRHAVFDSVGGVGEPVRHAGRPRIGQNIMLKPTLLKGKGAMAMNICLVSAEYPPETGWGGIGV